MPPPKNVSVTLTFDPVTLKTFSAMPTHMTNICDFVPSFIEIHPLSRDIASRRIGVHGRTDKARTTREHDALRGPFTIVKNNN